MTDVPVPLRDASPLPTAVAASLAGRVLDEVERAVVGKRGVLELVLVGLLSRGHVLLEDRPGLAKTLVARSFAEALDLRFARIQFTPDLLPADVTGSAVFDPRDQAFTFHRGPVFTDVLLGDEINRAPPKTQAALLEAMEEGQVTVDGATHALGQPFVVLATQNPIDFEGTYPLPEAQLDRFRLRLSVGYPGRDDEWEVLERRIDRAVERVELGAVADRDDMLALQATVEQVHVEETVGRYVVDVVRATREAGGVEVGASPRGALSLLQCARALALLRGRDHVLPDDVDHLAEPVLAHRLLLTTESWVRGLDTREVVRRVLADVPAPPTLPPAP